MPDDQMTFAREDDGVTTASAASRAWRASRAAVRGELPPRYLHLWHPEYNARVKAAFRPGMSILDVGAGRNPTIPPERRPAGCRYVGLDLSQEELEKAPPGGYDQAITANATEYIATLDESFDLVLSYLVLEHVADLRKTFHNLRSYLVPGGRFVAYFSGTFSAFGLANRILPSAISAVLLKTLMHREEESVFPAFYDHCWDSAIQREMVEWSTAEVKPMWYGAGYFEFFRPLQAAYIGYEEWVRLRDHRNLAPYYLVEASR